MAACIDACVHCLRLLVMSDSKTAGADFIHRERPPLHIFSYGWPVLYHSEMFLSVQATYYAVLSLYIYTPVDRDIINIRRIKLANETYQS